LPVVRTTVVLLALLSLTPLGVGAESTRRQKGDLAIEARGILRKYCAECHQGDTPTYGRVSVTDHSVLVRNAGPIPFVSKDAKNRRSQVIEFLEDGSMPPGGRERPTAAEIARLKEWIDVGAPSYPAAFDDATTQSLIADDFELQGKQDQPFLRYLSLAHLVPEPGQPSKLAQVEQELQKALLAASDGTMTAPPEPVDDTATLFRLDLRTVGWHHIDLFEKVEQEVGKGVFPMIPFDLLLLEDPFVPPTPSKRLEDVLKMMKQLRPVPYLRADWLTRSLWANDKPSPLADDLSALIRLAAKKGADASTGPAFRPFVGGVAVSAVVPPLGSWSATDVTPDPPPFKFTASLTDVEQTPIKAVKLNAPFRILAECDREVRLTLLTVWDDGQLSVTPIARGNRVAAGKSKAVYPENPDGDQAFTVASISKGRNEMTVHYVLLASGDDRPPPTVVRSRHAANRIWRFVPADPASRTAVRAVLKLTVNRN